MVGGNSLSAVIADSSLIYYPPPKIIVHNCVSYGSRLSIKFRAGLLGQLHCALNWRNADSQLFKLLQLIGSACALDVALEQQTFLGLRGIQP